MVQFFSTSKPKINKNRNKADSWRTVTKKRSIGIVVLGFLVIMLVLLPQFLMFCSHCITYCVMPPRCAKFLSHQWTLSDLLLPSHLSCVCVLLFLHGNSREKLHAGLQPNDFLENIRRHFLMVRASQQRNQVLVVFKQRLGSHLLGAAVALYSLQGNRWLARPLQLCDSKCSWSSMKSQRLDHIFKSLQLMKIRI